MQDSLFFRQARLMLRCLPALNAEKSFAVKGGTAINLFLRDMPRLSVDIDLTYLPVEPRSESLDRMAAALKRIAVSIERTIPGARVRETKERGGPGTIKLVVSQDNTQIKIEPNTTIRGAVFPTVVRSLCKKAVDMFALSVRTQTLSEEDLYGGKICAALDRQHPRDLFDVIDLAKKGLDEKTKQAFLFYLISHDRSLSDLLSPQQKDITQVFKDEFRGMTERSTTLEELLDARSNLIKAVHASLTDQDKRFLLSLKSGDPDWSLFPMVDASKFPAVQWKLLNIRKMAETQRKRFVDRLRGVLGIEE